MLGKQFSRQAFEYVYLIFLENMLCHFMQNVSPEETIFMKCQAYLPAKIRKYDQIVVSWICQENGKG